MLLAILISIIIYNTAPKNRGIDNSLMPYVEDVYILSKGNLNGKKLHINFDKTEPNVLGSCYIFKKEIVINKNKWKNLDYNSKILLMAHEIAHCAKDIEHIKGVDSYGCAEHFMYYSDTGYWCNRANFNKYIEQMRKI